MKACPSLGAFVARCSVAFAFATLELPTSADEPLLGVYGENSMQRVLEFEEWIGRPVDAILCTVDFHQWENYRYADWLSQTVYGERGERRLVYDVPIVINGASYAEARTGAYDEHWRSLAQSILGNNPGSYEVVVRPSHEMNGDWFAWGVGLSRLAQIPDFIESWRRFHGVFRSVEGGERFRFSFSASEGASDPRPMWPGDEYVDLVGYDVYWKPKAMGGEGWETDDPVEAWEKRTSPHGYNGWNLHGMLAFARERGKPFQIDEWGVWGPDAAPFVERMAAFLRENEVRAHTYWNSDAAYPGELHRRGREWSATTEAFRACFGKESGGE
ncbi:MAG TPA: glycosyl hydrolase [Bacteroidia bacterium]|nr:glycosyl hydrolase [Bacteroidia bacterium]